MSSCSASEIAEKKRIALEKLKAKKSIVGDAQHIPTPNLASKPCNNTAAPLATKRSATTTVENKASIFLNALKQSNVFANRQSARDAAHPYQRPSSAKQLTEQPLAKPNQQLAPVFRRTVTCRVYMISKFRFVVHPSEYHNALIDVFKTIPSRSYDSKTRLWSFALQDYQLVQQRVGAMKPDVVIGVIPECVKKLCLEPTKQLNYDCLASIESTLADKLMPFQKEGVCFGIAQHGRIMICDEMGLGKTYQALAIAHYYRENWPLLICTTASTRESWSNHIRQLLPSIPLHYIQVLANNQQYIGDAKVLITGYSMLERHFSKIWERKFDFLIFDESHTLKNNKSKCTVVAKRLAMHAKHVILLSGTPALSRPLELFTQLQLIDYKFINYMDFSSRYCDGKQTNFGWDASGQSNLEELHVMLQLKFMIRRTKAGVLPEMTKKSRETVVLDPALVWTNEEEKTTLDTFTNSLNASKGKEKEQILLKFYAQTAHVKTRAVCAYVKTLIKENKKFIIFAHHRVMMDAISECLLKLNVNYVRIDGSTRNDVRAEYIDMFQKKSACKVAVLSLKACNSGITLTAAEMIVFAELDWNPSTLAQAESRAHRIGQEKPVICRYLMASKTADDHIWNMLKHKQNVLNKAGLFCEDLQDATHTSAPTMSSKIYDHFSSTTVIPALESHENLKKTENLSTHGKLTDIDAHSAISKSSINAFNITNEIENINDFFNNNDDDLRTALDKLEVPSTLIGSLNHSTVDSKQEMENIIDFFNNDDDDFPTALGKLEASSTLTESSNTFNLKRELENINDFFNNDDDDDEFRNILV